MVTETTTLQSDKCRFKTPYFGPEQEEPPIENQEIPDLGLEHLTRGG